MAWQRWQWLVAVLVLLTLLTFALIFHVSAQAAADAQMDEQIQLYQGIPLDATLLGLDRRALDEAYHQQLLKLFGVWLSQGAPDAKNFTNGLRIARRAYREVATQISARESQILEKKPNEREDKP